MHHLALLRMRRAAALLGSGSTDLAGWLSAATTRPPDKWNLYGGGGLLLMNEGNVMPDQQRHLVAFGSLGLSMEFLPRLSVKGQLDMHSPFYSDSALRQLGRYAVQGLLGVDWEFAPRTFLAFSVSEDMVVGAAPDVTMSPSLSGAILAIDADEVNGDNRYTTWTPRLLRAAYNYQYVTKDPGAYAHNPYYIIQVLQDSLESLGGDVSSMMRPEVEAE